MGLDSLFLSYIIGNSIVSLWLLFKIKVFSYIGINNLNKKVTKEMIKYSFPLVPNNISWNAISLTDRLLIVNFLGAAKNGIYSVGLRFPTIINTCYSYFNLSWKESASKMVNKKDKDDFYNSVYVSLNRLLICVSILIIAFLPLVFNLLIKKDYREVYNYIPLMIISVYFSNLSNFCSGIFSAYKDTKILAKTTVVATIINFIVGIILIQKIGLYASILATLTAYIVIYFYRNYKLKKYITLKHDNYVIYHTIMLLIVVFCYYLKNIIIIILGALLALIYSYFANRSLLKPIIKKIKRK